MLGLDPLLGRGELFGELLPRARPRGRGRRGLRAVGPERRRPAVPDRSRASRTTSAWAATAVRSTDARRAGVRFAAECLAFANVPNEDAVAEVLPGGAASLAVDDRRWKAGVPRDAAPTGTSRTSATTTSACCYGLDPVAVRSADPARYLELSRAVSGEVMAEVFGEWRRPGSPCARRARAVAARPAARRGLGAARPLRRAEGRLAPRSPRARARRGVDDRRGPQRHRRARRERPRRGRSAVGCESPCTRAASSSSRRSPPPSSCAAHAASTHNVEALLGRFADVSYAYRFGPPGHDALVASLEQEDGLVSQAVRFPAGRPLEVEAARRARTRGRCGAGRLVASPWSFGAADWRTVCVCMESISQPPTARSASSRGGSDGSDFVRSRVVRSRASRS